MSLCRFSRIFKMYLYVIFIKDIGEIFFLLNLQKICKGFVNLYTIYKYSFLTIISLFIIKHQLFLTSTIFYNGFMVFLLYWLFGLNKIFPAIYTSNLISVEYYLVYITLQWNFFKCILSKHYSDRIGNTAITWYDVSGSSY